MSASDSQTSDPFFDVYDRDDPAYGLKPSAELSAYLAQCRPTGNAIDLGAGAGRDTLELARAGLKVLAVDQSQRGLDLILQRGRKAGLSEHIATQAADVRDIDLPADHYAVISATTVLDHIPADSAQTLWSQMVQSLTDGGALYAEVHTTDDPGSRTGRGADSDAPVSETAVHVINHFPPNQLLQWASDTPGLRVLRYEERWEWDYTHGPEHLHGKAILLASKSEQAPQWFGHPAAFLKQPSKRE